MHPSSLSINILFVIMFSPVCLSFYNGINGIEHTIINTHIHEPIKPWYIWEEQRKFGNAFKLARALLGSNEVFTWNGKEYTTLYKEEL